MSIKLYDLCGLDESFRFSPTCWRAKAALAHKGVDFETIATPFTKIKEHVATEQKTLPYLESGGDKVVDSFAIALYLEEKFPEKPKLFNGPEGVAAAKFVQSWTNTTLIPLIIKLVVKNIHDSLAATDQAYFRKTRENMLGARLEDVQNASQENIEAFREGLKPLRTMLAEQRFIGGKEPLYADLIVYGTLKWALKTAGFDIFASDDPVKTWFEAIDQRYEGV